MRKPVRRVKYLSLCVLLALVFSGAVGVAQPPAGESVTPEPFPFSDRYPAQVTLTSPDDLSLLVRLQIDVGNVRPADETSLFPRPDAPFEPLVATLYINDKEAALLESEGLAAEPIPNEGLRAWKLYGPGTEGPEAWPSYEDLEARMQGIASSYPDLVRLVSIGESVQGRDLWALKISDNPDDEEDEPEFKYSSTAHGNESVGTEMTLRLAELLTSSYGGDPGLTQLVDEIEIWLVPLHNPDGYVAGTRYNAHGQDLNRDFPDRITDPSDDPTGREPETQAFMHFGYDHRFVMGANYHTGTLVVNYPWDTVPSPPDYAPDDAIFYEYSVGYASRNPMIWNGPFANGVTRGWEWYIIRGGMQDWAYHWQGEHHVTIENSYSQPPPYSQMDEYWDAEGPAMIWWMGRVLNGARGLVTDAATGEPLDATVDVLELGKEVRTDPDVGDYHRLLLPGTYTILCSAEGYIDQTWTVDVADGAATVKDCEMVPESGLTTMHVDGIKMRYRDFGGGRYIVYGLLRILDEFGQRVVGAEATVEWTLPGGTTEEQQALTNPQGVVRFRVRSRDTGAFELCVTDVTAAGYLYDPSQNGETCDTLTLP